MGRWMQRDHAIPDWRVWNIDETSCRLLPCPDKAWSPRGETAGKLGNDRMQTTVTLAVCLADDTPLMAQVLSRGKTLQVVPPGPHPEGIFVSRTESGWQSADSLQDQH